MNDNGVDLIIYLLLTLGASPDDQLGAHFDFMARHGELKHDHVLLEIRRFNDLYKLVFDEIK